jgi:MFS family permease
MTSGPELGRDGQPAASGESRRPPWVSGGVASVGAASFFSDAGHEIATAVLPSFLTSVLRGSAGVLGIIEGLSDGMLGIAKLAAGPPANDPTRRARIARGGYLLTAVLTAAIGLSSAIWQVGVLRAAAWASRGARGPARDALLASLAPRDAYGRSFGVERAGDNLGAVVGPLLAALLVAVVGIRRSFYFALIPGLFAALAISVAAARAPRVAAARERARLELGSLRRAGLFRPLLPVAMFELGNVTTTLLILRATGLLHHGSRSLTAAASLAILIYAAHNVVAAVTALVGGGWIDRGGPERGPRRVFTAGAALYVVAYGGFALAVHAWPLLLALFCLAGAGIGLAETAESTLVANLLPDRLRGSGFGLLGGLQSTGYFLSSAVVGVLYAALSPTVGFAYAAAWMVLSVAASAFTLSPRRAIVSA